MLHREAKEMSYAVVFVINGFIKSECVDLIPMEMSKPKFVKLVEIGKVDHGANWRCWSSF